MLESQLITLTVNALPATPTNQPSTIATARGVPTRVLVKNTGAVLVFLATSISDLTPAEGPSSGVFRLAPGAEEILILAPDQKLYAYAVVGGSLLSIATSDAFPEMMWPGRGR